MRAPFPWFGGKSKIADVVWSYFGDDCKQYIEPFCGSAAVLLANPRPCSLEVVNDANCYLANFWRATKSQPENVARWADYPVSHIDLGARHQWLLARGGDLGAGLQDPDWPGDAKAAGWWLWGQCCWIGSGWCEPGKAPHISDAGMGVQAIGQVPHISDAGMGVQAIGQVPHISDAGMGTAGAAALRILGKISARLDRVRILCGDWSRCLNNHYGGDRTAVFLDPPYDGTEALYGEGADRSVWTDVVKWATEKGGSMRIILCGHAGDAEMDGWRTHRWSRAGNTYGGSETKDDEALWISPACKQPTTRQQLDMFGEARQ